LLLLESSKNDSPWSDMTEEQPIRSILRVASLPLCLCAGVVTGTFVGALFGRPGIGFAIGAALGLTIGLSLSAAFVVRFVSREGQ
jgi:uncharacterized membrane protein